jgi:hypothetical protein
MSKDKYLVIKGKAGMGNRMLTVLDGILYSRITNRKLIIDWSDYTYSNDKTNVFSFFFTIPNTSSNIEEVLDANSVYPPIWRNHLNKSASEMIDEYENSRHGNISRILSKYTIDIRRIDYVEDVLVRWSYSGEIYKLRRLFKGEFFNFSALNDEAIWKKLLGENLTLNQDIQNRVSSYKKKFFKEKIIGMHIRYTDLKTSLKKYPKILDRILQKYPESLIFIATDNRLAEAHFKEIYGSNNIALTEKWYPDDSKHLHQNSECPDRFENGVQALVDMYLLANCDYFICDQNSTFSLVANLISDLPEANVIDISRRSLKKNIKNFKKLIY